MPTLKNRLPAYRLFKPRNLACVTIDGKRVYLGPYGTPESRAEYARLIAELEQRGRRPHVPSRRELRRAKVAVAEPVPLAMVELVDRFLAHARGYYVKDGQPTNELAMFVSALRPVVRLYGRLPAREFRPEHLKAVREDLVRNGWTRTTKKGRVLTGRYCRKSINGYMRRIRQVFGWAVEEIPRFPASVHERLRRVKPLLQGRTAAHERAPVRAVDDATIERTLPWLTPTVRSLVQFQRLTGCRPHEACEVRPCDVDTAGDVWVYRPGRHKSQHVGKTREVYIGPKAQDLLRPLLLRPSEAYCFDPRDSEKKRGRSASPIVRDHYDKHTYGRCIARGIVRANRAEAKAAAKEGRDPVLVPKWTANALRHARATELRRLFGVESARVALGHSDATLTAAVYAEQDATLAADVARRTG